MQAQLASRKSRQVVKSMPPSIKTVSAAPTAQAQAHAMPEVTNSAAECETAQTDGLSSRLNSDTNAGKVESQEATSGSNQKAVTSSEEQVKSSGISTAEMQHLSASAGLTGSTANMALSDSADAHMPNIELQTASLASVPAGAGRKDICPSAVTMRSANSKLPAANASAAVYENGFKEQAVPTSCSPGKVVIVLADDRKDSSANHCSQGLRENMETCSQCVAETGMCSELLLGLCCCLRLSTARQLVLCWFPSVHMLSMCNKTLI